MVEPSGKTLALRNISKRHGNVAAIDDIGLEVAPGEFLTLLGPSGSGKTSLLMAIAGLLQPDSGDIFLGGTRINDLPAERRNFGMVFQGYALFPHMNVRANVAYPLTVRKMARLEIDARVKRALDWVQLTEFADRFPRQLSGGQQQRVALARALVFEPALVLLDEPLSALDRKLRGELQSELQALHKRLGTTFILVTHDQEEALALSDRIVVLRNGRVVQMGSPSELYHRPVNRFVAEFLGRANFLNGIVTEAQPSTLAVALYPENPSFNLATSRPARVGEPITLALRPEQIGLANGTDHAPGWQRVAGEVKCVNFTGQHYVYVTDTPLGSLIAALPSAAHANAIVPGSRVTLTWPEQALMVLND